jgi:hypothetical protein
MERPTWRAFAAIALCVYVAAGVAFVDWTGSGESGGASRCEEAGAAGFTPTFCLDIPNIQANARDLSFTLFSDADAACADQRRAYAGTICGADLDALSTVSAPDAGGPADVVCAEQGSPGLTPRTCVHVAVAMTQVRTGADEAPVAPGARDDRGLADVHFDTTLDPRVAARVASAADQAVADLEHQFGRSFVRRPALYVFGTAEAFTSGVVRLFGYPQDAAAVLGATHGGVFIPGPEVIALNWQRSQQGSIVRHELTHLLVHQIVGSQPIPAWLDEGLATSDWETSLVGGDPERYRYSLRTLAERGQVQLARLTFGGEYSLYEYAFAAEAVRAISKGDAAVITHLLDDVARGASFSSAFASRTGAPLAQFEADFGTRFVASVPVPKLFQLPADANGNIVFLAYGYTPRSTLQVQISGPSYRLHYSLPNDALGIAAGTFGSTAPPGVYDVTVTGPVRTATIRLRTGG